MANKLPKIFILVAVFTLLSATIIRASSLYGWVFYNNNQPILSPSLQQEGNNIYGPDVHKEGTIWKMWYGGQGDDGHDRIFYATSGDGITWRKIGVVMANGGSTNGSPNLDNDPSVVKVGSTYYMYYTEWAGHDRVLLATSTDGISWIRKATVVDTKVGKWGDNYAARPTVIYEKGVWKLWYDSINAATKIRGVGYATSTDGINFVRYAGNPVLNGAATVDVKHVGNKYVLLYEGTAGIYFALSDNGTNFVSKGLLFTKSGGAADSRANVTPMLYLDDTGKPARVYFGGGATLNTNRIFMAYGGTIPETNSTPAPVAIPGDIDGSGHVDINDLNVVKTGFGKTYTIFDYNKVVANFGR